MGTNRLSKAEKTEQEITKHLAAAGIRLRFDKVALRLLNTVKAEVGQSLPEHQSIAFTVTAPIRLPAKTSAALRELLHRLDFGELSTTINGNHVQARIVDNAASDKPRVVGFVHNRENEAGQALDIAEATLREP